ncbi:hypothetical protein ACR78H_07720 [Sphingobacterium siyangense]|uniref:hypothetical protein n=1 Tax=Sphingobacterium siyangense TaxID=459529 RepID=UPI003DA3F17A
MSRKRQASCSRLMMTGKPPIIMPINLGATEGRALQLPQDAHKIESLLETGSGYRIFLNRIKDENWDKRMLKL